MLKRIFIFTALMVALSTSVYASDFKAVVNYDDGSVFGVGKSCEGKTGSVFVTVAYPEIDIDTLSFNSEQVSYMKGIITDEYGNFDFSYTLNNIKAGTYQVDINDGCAYLGHRESFDVSTVSKAQTAVEEFNILLQSENKVISDFEEFINSNNDVFGVELNDEYFNCDKDILWKIMKNATPYSSNVDVFKNFYSAIEIVKVGSAAELEIPEILGKYILFSESQNRQLYEKMDTVAIKRLCSNVKNMKFNTLTFDKEFRKMLIVEIFNNTDRNLIKENIEIYAQEIGIDIAVGSDFRKIKNPTDVYVGMANNESFKTYDDIKILFNDLVKNCLEKENKKNNSSSASSGGSSGGGNGVPVVTIPSKNELENNLVNDSYLSFKDIDEVPWARDAIKFLHEKNIVNGVNDKEFMPNRNVTREEFVKMIVLAFDVYDDKAVPEFEDVVNSAWYAPYVASGVKAGIVNGVGDGRFGVGNYITRQDMTVMLYRMIQTMKIDILESDVEEFYDAEFFASYAKEPIERLSAMGIVNGVGDGMFAPESSVTRAMAATVIARIIDR